MKPRSDNGVVVDICAPIASNILSILYVVLNYQLFISGHLCGCAGSHPRDETLIIQR